MKNEITALRLKEALSDLDMKPQELADRSGVSKASISQYLSGSHAPSNISSGKMGKILRVEPMWLMGFDVSKKKEQTPDMAKEDFKLLEKYSEGLICTTACIASATSQAIVNNNEGMATKILKKFKNIFGKDLYVEIQPYKIDTKNTQEKTDLVLMRLAEILNIKCILTSDSHFGRKEDFDTYCKMHEIGKTALDVKNTG